MPKLKNEALVRGLLLASATVVLVGCGGSGGGGEGETLPGSGVTQPLEYSIALTADATQLPLNVVGASAGIGVNAPYTTTLYVTASRAGTNDPIPDTADAFSCNVIPEGLQSGALYYLDGDDDHEDDDGNPVAYRAITLDSSAGGASFHFHAGNTAGRATVTCVVRDPQSGKQVTAQQQISVGQTSGSSAQAQIIAGSGFLYAQNTNGPSALQLQARVLDDAGQAVPNPAAGIANVIASIVPTTGAADDFALLSAGGQLGKTVTLSTIRGLASFSLISGADTGSVLVQVVTDRADNNVTNGIRTQVGNLASIAVVDGATSGDPLVVSTTGALPEGAVGQPYATILSASGGVPPYAWSLRSGSSLPGGLTLSSDGIISGAPVAGGTSRFVVQATDSANASATAQQELSLTVTGGSSAALAISAGDLPKGTVGVYYAGASAAEGGARPYAWSSTTLPAGLVLDSRTGFITGIPTASGTFSVVLTVTDAAGTRVNRNLSMVIDGAVGGGAGVDSTPPQMLFTIPASNSTDVNRCSDIVVRFNEAIDPVTVTNVSMFVRRAGGATFSMFGTSVVDERTFLLNQGLANCYAPGTNYELVLTNSIRDISDNALAQVVVPFSTGGEIDDVAPKVAFTIPADGAVDVSPTADVTVVFNEAMDADSIVPQSFAVYRIDRFDGNPTQVTVGAGSDVTPSTLATATELIAETDRRFTFGPVEYIPALPAVGINLVPGQHYRVVMSTSPRDLAGNQICEEESGQCGTIASPDDGGTPSYSFEFRVGVQ